MYIFKRYYKKSGEPSKVTVEIDNRFSKKVLGKVEFPLGTGIEMIPIEIQPGGKISEVREFPREWETPPYKLTITEPEELRYWSQDNEGLKEHWIKNTGIPYLGLIARKIGLIR